MKYEPLLFGFKVFLYAKTQVIPDKKSCLMIYFKLDVAYGKYAFMLKQYDKNDNVIIQTDYITFIIEQPQVDCGHWNII